MKGYIYQIKNNINGKIYIGQTSISIEERWRQHLRDANIKDYHLYRAFKKYGIENFTISILEEVSDNINERERYWIQLLDSYNNGYNSTFGGEGSVLYDYQAIGRCIEKGLGRKDIAQIFNCDIDVVSRAAKALNITLKNQAIEKKKIKVTLISNDIHPSKVFESAREAIRYLEDNGYKKSKGGGHTHILEVARGIRNTAYGFKWKFTDDLD